MSSLPASTLCARGRDQALEQRRPQDRRAPRRAGPGSLSASGSGSRGDEAERVGLEEAGADEHVLDEAPEALILRQASEHRAPERERERDRLEPVDARDLLDQVDLPGDVARAPRGDVTSQPGATSNPSRVEDVLLLLLGDLDADDPVRRARAGSVITGGSGSSPSTSAWPVQRAPASSTISCVASRAACWREVRIDALLPAVRALGAQRMALGAPEDRARLEVGGLEQDGRRLLGDLCLEPAHDPGEGDRAARRRR